MVLEDGPAAGRYSVMRAPHFVRAVIDRKSGRTDLLDQLIDEPMPTEAVYEATGSTWDSERSIAKGIFLCPPPGASGTYRHRADVDGEDVRTTAGWRAWCRAQPVTRTMVDGETREPVAVP